MKEFQSAEWLKKPLAKVVDFVPLGALSGPGAPDPDLTRFHIKVKHRILNISLYICKNMEVVSFNLFNLD